MLPYDMLGEIFNKLPYFDIINVCKSNKYLLGYCQHTRAKFDNLLITELLNCTSNNLNGALFKSIYANNINVFRTLILMGGDPITVLSEYYINFGKVSNIKIILLLLQLTKNNKHKPMDEKHVLHNCIMYKCLGKRDLFPYLLHECEHCLKGNILAAIRIGKPIIDIVLENFEPSVFFDTDRDRFGFIGYYFFLSLLLYTSVYQPPTLYHLVNFVNNDLRLLKAFLQNKATIVYDINNIAAKDVNLSAHLYTIRQHMNYFGALLDVNSISSVTSIAKSALTFKKAR